MHFSSGFVDGLAIVEQHIDLPHVRACLPPHVPVPKPGPCPGRKRTAKPGRGLRRVSAPKVIPHRPSAKRRWPIDVGEALPEPGDDQLADDVEESLREVFDFTHGDVFVTNLKFEVEDGKVSILGDFRDTDGNDVGSFTRTLQRDEDEPDDAAVEHDFLSLEHEYQGQGLASAFNKHLFDWYRESGVQKVALTANIDAGGYVWARAGYDWENPADAKTIADRLEDVVLMLRGRRPKHVTRDLDAHEKPQLAKIPKARLDAQIAAAEAMVKRLRTGRFSAATFPTPYEVSELGRWDGADRDEWHIGKVSMLGSSWRGQTKP